MYLNDENVCQCQLFARFYFSDRLSKIIALFYYSMLIALIEGNGLCSINRIFFACVYLRYEVVTGSGNIKNLVKYFILDSLYL